MTEIPGYVVGEVIGRGSSSVVRRGTRERDGRAVAIKVTDRSAEEAAWELARSQVGAAPGLVTVHEVLTLSDGRVAVVMDLAAGGSLAAVVAARGHLTVAETVTVMVPVAEALAALHASGSVHGDLSPGNVLLNERGRPLLADLGAGRAAGETPSVERWGTTGFAAPELEVGEVPGPEADVHGWGALTWFCLTGCAPPHWLARDPLPDLLERQGLTSPEHAAVAQLMARAMAYSPQARPSAVALAHAMYAVCPPRPLRLVSDPAHVEWITERIRVTAREVPPPEPGRHRRATTWRWQVPAVWRGAAGLGLAAALVVLGALLVAGPRDQATASASTPSPRAAPETRHGPGASGPPAAAPSAASSATADLRLQRAAVTADPVGLLQRLVDERARAWATGTLDPLDQVDAPGSPARERDVGLVSVLRDRGLRYSGLGFTVRAATPEGDQGSRARLRARVDTTAYVVVGGDTSEQRPAAAGPEVVVDLAWSAQGWRVVEVTEG